MGLRKDVKDIQNKLNELNKVLTPKIINKANKMDETEDYLRNINLKIKSAKKFVTETGEEQLKLEYEIDPIYLQFDENNDIVYNPTFYAINMLNLISPLDMSKISSAIEKAKNKKK